jgi:Leucine-rich repeat (LRR) protein
MFTKLPNLKEIDISKNLLSELPDDISASSILTKIDAAYNQLTEVTEAMCMLRNLTFLDLSHNQITIFPGQPLSNLGKNMVYLALHANFILTLPIEICDF